MVIKDNVSPNDGLNLEVKVTNSLCFKYVEK